MKLFAQIIKLVVFLSTSSFLVGSVFGLIQINRDLRSSELAFLGIIMFFCWMTRPKVDED